MSSKEIKCAYCGSSNLSYDYSEKTDFYKSVMILEVTITLHCNECHEYTRLWEKYKVGDLLESEISQA